MFVFIKGKEIQIDPEDLHILDAHKWFWSNGGYLIAKIPVAPYKRRSIGIHRLIMGDPTGLVIDHINHDHGLLRRIAGREA